MRNVGLGLTIGGSAWLVLGAVLEVTTDLYDSSPMVVGVALAGVTSGIGLIFLIRGQSKKNYYNRKLERFSFDINGDHRRALTLTYKL